MARLNMSRIFATFKWNSVMDLVSFHYAIQRVIKAIVSSDGLA
jgi:hypothetical protein